jgi:Sec-independent protein translocase protein TatA
MKLLFSPVGIALIAIVLFILFFPRRPGEKLRKFGKPMRAFDEEPMGRSPEDSEKADRSA